MATANDFLEAAASYIGWGGTDNPFNTWYWGRHVYDPYVYPWCAAFQSYVGVHDLGMDFKPSASAAGVAWQGTQVPTSDVEPGDWVLFNWDGRADFGWADHIGVVEWFDSSTGRFGTIEGNTGSTSGGQVLRVNRSTRNGYSVKFFRPPYEAYEEPEPVPLVAEVTVPKKGSPVYRLYQRGTGEHFYTSNSAEKDALKERGWIFEGVAWANPDPRTPVYRMYQPGKKHLFTSNFNEALTLTDSGWIFEGVNFFGSDQGGDVKVWRLYNQVTGDHFLTADEAERDSAAANGYSFEGEAFTL